MNSKNLIRKNLGGFLLGPWFWFLFIAWMVFPAYGWNEENLASLHDQLQRGGPVRCVGYDLSGADLKNLPLRGADFSHCHLEGARFSGCILSKANFSKARLKKCFFYETDIRGARFKKANTNGAGCFDCRVNGTIFEDTSLSHQRRGMNRQLDLHGKSPVREKFLRLHRWIGHERKKGTPKVDVITGRGLHNPRGRMGVLWRLCQQQLNEARDKGHIKGCAPIGREGGWRIFLNQAPCPKKNTTASLRHQKYKKQKMDRKMVQGRSAARLYIPMILYEKVTLQPFVDVQEPEEKKPEKRCRKKRRTGKRR